MHCLKQHSLSNTWVVLNFFYWKILNWYFVITKIKGGTAKIADIGLAKPIHHIQGTIIGTPVYMAPEVLVGNIYGLPADIFSLAIMIWEMWHGRRVFSEIEYSGVMTTYSSVKVINLSILLEPVFHIIWSEQCNILLVNQ